MGEEGLGTEMSRHRADGDAEKDVVWTQSRGWSDAEQTKGDPGNCQELPEAGRSKEDASPESWGGGKGDPTDTFRLCPSELWQNKLVFLSEQCLCALYDAGPTEPTRHSYSSFKKESEKVFQWL